MGKGSLGNPAMCVIFVGHYSYQSGIRTQSSGLNILGVTTLKPMKNRNGKKLHLNQNFAVFHNTLFSSRHQALMGKLHLFNLLIPR